MLRIPRGSLSVEGERGCSCQSASFCGPSSFLSSSSHIHTRQRERERPTETTSSFPLRPSQIAGGKVGDLLLIVYIVLFYMYCTWNFCFQSENMNLAQSKATISSNQAEGPSFSGLGPGVQTEWQGRRTLYEIRGAVYLTISPEHSHPRHPKDVLGLIFDVFQLSSVTACKKEHLKQSLLCHIKFY